MKESIKTVEDVISKVSSLNVDTFDNADGELQKLITDTKIGLLDIRHNLRFSESMENEYALTSDVKKAILGSAGVLLFHSHTLGEKVDKITSKIGSINNHVEEYNLMTDGLDRNERTTRAIFANYESTISSNRDLLIRHLKELLPMIGELKEASSGLALNIGTIINKESYYPQPIGDGDKVVLRHDTTTSFGLIIICISLLILCSPKKKIPAKR